MRCKVLQEDIDKAVQMKEWEGGLNFHIRCNCVIANMILRKFPKLTAKDVDVGYMSVVLRNSSFRQLHLRLSPSLEKYTRVSSNQFQMLKPGIGYVSFLAEIKPYLKELI